jgi:hypothetical protein
MPVPRCGVFLSSIVACREAYWILMPTSCSCEAMGRNNALRRNTFCVEGNVTFKALTEFT